MSPFPVNFHELLDVLGNVFERYVPWHSEAEKVIALEKVAATRAHIIAADAVTIGADFTKSEIPAGLAKLSADVVQTPSALTQALKDYRDQHGLPHTPTTDPSLSPLYPAPAVPQSYWPTSGVVALSRTPDVAQSDALTAVANYNYELNGWITDVEYAFRNGNDMVKFMAENPAPVAPVAPVADVAPVAPVAQDFVYPTMPEKSL